MNPKWTIGICTWNGARLLEQTLDSAFQLHGLDSDADPTEILVINNGSTDNTIELLRKREQQPGFRHVLETRLGHTHARNRLVQEARGEVILWTDADVRLDRRWLLAYRESVSENPECSFWGGPIRPVFLDGKPLWVARNYDLLAGCFAHKDLGDEPMALDPSHLPYGANFAVRTEIARQFPFDVALGRRGKGCIGEDERDFLFRILSAGHQGRWVPDACVDHLIPHQRTRLDYIARYFAGQAAVQWRRQEAPAWSTQQFRNAARDHLVWFRLTRWSSPSRVWLEHWIKAAQFQQWADLTVAANPVRDFSSSTGNSLPNRSN